MDVIRLIVGVDPATGDDHAARAVMSVGHGGVIRVLSVRVVCVIIDDPHNDLRTYEGEFHEVKSFRLAEAARNLHHNFALFDDPYSERPKLEKLPAAVNTTPSRGPKPRTKYPRRR